MYEELQGTAKTILNSIYGVVAYNKFILFNEIIPASITSTARQLNYWVQQQSRNNNFIPLYGDTDSIFLSLESDKSFDVFVNQVKDFKIILNTSFKDFMKKFTSNNYVIENQKNEINFEKSYNKILFTNTKKRYFGTIKYYKGKIKEEETLSVTGLETRRDDTPNYFKQHLLKMYKILLDSDKDKVREYFNFIKKDIKKCKVEDLIIKIKMSRDVNDYENIPIHLRALQNSGIEIRRGEQVQMIYVKGDKEVLHWHEGLNNYEIDFDKYIENFFVNKILLIDENLKDIFNKDRSLGEFIKW